MAGVKILKTDMVGDFFHWNCRNKLLLGFYSIENAKIS